MAVVELGLSVQVRRWLVENDGHRMTNFTERDSLNITECEWDQSSYGIYSYPAYGTALLALA